MTTPDIPTPDALLDELEDIAAQLATLGLPISVSSLIRALDEPHSTAALWAWRDREAERELVKAVRA